MRLHVFKEGVIQQRFSRKEEAHSLSVIGHSDLNFHIVISALDNFAPHFRADALTTVIEKAVGLTSRFHISMRGES